MAEAGVTGSVEAPILRHLPAVAAAGLALLVLWAPLPFASVEPAAATALVVVAALLLVVAAPAARPHRLRPVAVPAAALAALAVLGALQALPWPPALVGLLSPRHGELWRRAAELAAPVEGLAAARWPRLSVAPADSLRVALLCAGLALLLVAAALAGRRRRHRRWLAVAVVAAALFQVLYGARHLLAGSRQIWGVAVPGVGDRLRGTFVNPNHLAYLLEIALAVALAAAWWAVAHGRRRGVSLERRLILVALPALAWLVLLAGLALTSSRSGLVAAVAGAAVQGVLVALPRRRWRAAPLGLAAALVGLAVVAGVVSQRAFGRLAETSLYDVAWSARLRVTGLTLELWRRFPLSGSGLGTFDSAFGAVEPADLEGSVWLHAHNDWVELAATGGVVAVVLVAVGLVALGRRLQRVLVRGHRSEDRAAALAAFGALAAVAVHETFDFGLTMPAVSVTLVAVCGAAAAARTSSRRGSAEGSGGER